MSYRKLRQGRNVFRKIPEVLFASQLSEEPFWQQADAEVEFEWCSMQAYAIASGCRFLESRVNLKKKSPAHGNYSVPQGAENFAYFSRCAAIYCCVQAQLGKLIA